MTDTYKEQDQIIGVQIGLNVDCLFFTPIPIDNEKDELKLKESVGKFSTDLRKLINKTFNQTEMDDTMVNTVMINYITPNNIDDYITYDEIIVDG